MGLDLSMTGTGLVVCRRGTRTPLTSRRIETLPMTQFPKRAESQLWKGKFYGQEDERIEYITAKCMRAWNHFRPQITVIEGYAFGAKGNALTALHELGGVMKNKLLAVEAVYVIVPPAQLKLFATGNGRASKEWMVEAAQEIWPDCPSEDEADALHAAKLGVKDYAKLTEAA